MIIDKESVFFKRSRLVVRDFLQTTVIIDDMISYTNSYEEPLRLTNYPGRISSTNRAVDIGNIDDIDLGENPSGQILMADLVISGFAANGIVCSIINPNSNHNKFHNDLIKLTSNSDTLILDWELEKEDNGDLALATLTKIIEGSNIHPEQLRLIVIYTGKTNISQVSERIKENFKENITEIDDFTFSIGATRISIYIKSHALVDDTVEHKKVKMAQLVDIVIDEFTMMNAGLVSNTVLRALSVVRQNSSKIINKFSPHLDAPYLTHRALLPCTEDAEFQIPNLLSEEIRSILEESLIGQDANIDAIKDWLLLHKVDDFRLKVGDNFVPISKDIVVSFLEVGIAACKCEQINEKKALKSLTKMFMFDSDDHKFLDEEFSLITTNRSSYKKVVPGLTFGTIIQKLNDKSYWVCLQPRCDSVRIDTCRAFPFLPLVKNDGKFNLTLKESDEYIRLSLQKKPSRINMIYFKPDTTSRRIKAKLIKKNDHFFIDKKRFQYKWVGELRSEQAQRIVNQFAAELSRVGVDESEWLRRHSG